ncbi:extracellular solute-binding protein [Homoserinibacter sp. GY 40078]|uniref:extracellular solute-binding protein n=1 Tax=Homoserinibacter sp. GY 40078 TaxID=2603275 RepID=UPI0011CC9B30|nr:extracellular solute-binding protein [Homoserinibacter sp. GY 40078]TXK18774.1 extracellular solute-binding protein [Homoserinibacter sp. GY 40078]
MKIRKAGAMLLTFSVIAGLSACSSGDDTDGPVEIVVWDTGLLAKNNEDGSVGDNSFLHAAAEKFEDENPGITIDIVQQGGDISANAAQFQAASIAGNGPDIRVQYAGGPTLSFEDFFVDLSDVFDQETLDDITGWDTVRAGYDTDGAILALPYGSGSYFTVFYDKDRLRNAGMDPDVEPTSWEEMLEIGEEYTAATGAAPIWFANLEGYVGAWVVAALAGGELGSSAFTDMYRGDTKIDSPEMAAAYQTYADLYADGLTNPDAGEVSNGDNLSGYLAGDQLYYFSGMWDDVVVTENIKDPGVFFIPMPEDSAYTSVAAGGPNVAVSVTNYSKHQEEAEEFLKFLAQPEIQDMYVEMYQVEPSNSRSADPSVIQNPLLQEQAAELQNIETFVYPFDNVMPQAVIDLFYRLNASTFLGTTTPDSAVEQLQAALDAEQQ